MAELKNKTSKSQVEPSQLYLTSPLYHPNFSKVSKVLKPKQDMQLIGSGSFTPFSDVDSPTKLTRQESKILNSHLGVLKN
jgi:hypothetical protein